jgi:ATP synthase protein I
VAHVGVLGWLIALPTVGGAYLGHRLDERFDAGITWALCFLSLGLAGGGYLLWRTFHQVSEEESP